jgi:hypothetical protein
MNRSGREAARELAEEAHKDALDFLLNSEADVRGAATLAKHVAPLVNSLLSALSWGEETERENKRLQEALRFYADEDNYFYDDPNVSSGGPTLFEDEGGAKARDALSPSEARKETP